MKCKTISGHYGTAYSIKHNNRDFIPHNVDPNRVQNNYNCIAVGQPAFPCGTRPVHVSEMWEQYRYVCDLYRTQRELYRTIEMERTKQFIRDMREIYRDVFYLPYNSLAALLELLFLPLLIPTAIAASALQKQAMKELEEQRLDQWVRDVEFKYLRQDLRTALKCYDAEKGTHLCAAIEELACSTLILDDEGKYVNPHDHCKYSRRDYSDAKFATIEEIYEKCFEPSFRHFQEQQRPCRRYEGTYLEQIREKQVRAERSKGSKNEKNRAVAEAIEIVFTIGDMDNTGYERAPADAQLSEPILKDFCRHLMWDQHLCYVTTREINDPNWQPPFKHGLLVLNLSMHADEATPGVHLTCIPYSRGCRRGPDTQASLGRAMTGMGYPSTWVDVLDENGKPIPKRDRNGNIIYNSDGTVRCQQEPDKQGILDWIEEQKQWIALEMQKRYGWEREYKGSHPRGNLSTPDYKVAKAQERLAEMERLAQRKLEEYEARVSELTASLERAVSVNWDSAVERDVIQQYLMTCPDDQYEELLNVAMEFLEKLPAKEQAVALKSFQELLANAQNRAAEQAKNTSSLPTHKREL